MAEDLAFYDTNAAGTYQAYSQPPPPIISPPTVTGDVTIVTNINGATGGRITFEGSAIGVAFTGSQGGVVTMSISNAALFRSAIGAAESGVNTDITELNGASQVDVSGVYKVNGTQVVKEQQPAIPDADGTLPGDTTTINSILAAMRAHGLIDV